MTHGEAGSITLGADRERRSWSAPPSVRRIDALARSVVTVSGILVLIAVLGILAYLLWVVAPLFLPARAQPHPAGQLTPSFVSKGLVALRANRQAELAAILAADGSVQGIHLPSGNTVPEAPTGLELPAPITAFAASPTGPAVALGLADGTLCLGTFAFEVSYPGDKEFGGPQRLLAPGESMPWRDGVLARMPGGSWRFSHPSLAVEAVLPPPEGEKPAPIRRLALQMAEDEGVVLALREGQPPLFVRVRRVEDFLTGEPRLEHETFPLPLPQGEAADRFGCIDERGSFVLLVSPKGRFRRIDIRDPASARIVEEGSLLTAPGRTITDVRLLLGDQSILVGDDQGETAGWFLLADDRSAGNDDHRRLQRVRGFDAHALPVHRLIPSGRSKQFVSVSRDGETWLQHFTSGRTVLKLQPRMPSAPALVTFAPKEDAVVAAGRSGVVWSWSIHAPHPDVSLGMLFSRVWYEGYPEPAYVWQSTGGSDDYEPKWSLVPLFAGTVKGTLYSLLFAVPIGILAALFTSEFLHPRVRAGIKPAIELMASIPSVVLGFLAALILAPLVEASLLPLLLAGISVPAALALGGFVYQLFPVRNERTRRWSRGVLVIAATAFGVWAGIHAAGGIERFFFDGDFRSWLTGRSGRPTPLNAVLLLPLTTALTILAQRHIPLPALQPSETTGSVAGALLEITRGILFLTVTLATAWLAGLGLDRLGLDPRAFFCGPYAPRNTLIVSFAMGFAVIPILYTLTEDALRSVPSSLRSASLACGASPWQTAMRVVLPLAAPGIFSAIMIAFGRAVGETMIVLMATGNTPILSGNLFQGFRALSANLAVELPEAAAGGSLYRVLFLSASLLFLLTLAVNTAAEVVRQRSRRRMESL